MVSGERLVIGYGNPLRADDGLGWVVGETLAAELPEPSAGAAQVLTVHQLTPELAEPISRASLVIFVDAQEGAAGSDGAVGLPGQVHRYPVAPDSDGALAFSHDVDPPALLTLARVLYGSCPPALVVSVTGHDFGYGEGLSAPVQEALPAVLQQVRQALSDHDAGVLDCTLPVDRTPAATAGPRTERG